MNRTANAGCRGAIIFLLPVPHRPNDTGTTTASQQAVQRAAVRTGQQAREPW